MKKKMRAMIGAVALTGGLAAAGLGGMAASAAVDTGAGQSHATFKGGLEGVFQTAVEKVEPSGSERRALDSAIKNGRIAPAAYEQAHRKYVNCMEKQGYNPEFRKTSDGLYMELPYQEVSEALDAATIDCAKGTATLTALYHIQQANPGALSDQRQVAVKCLTEGGFVKAGYTASEFESDQLMGRFSFDPAASGPNDCLYGAGYAYFDMDQ